VMLVSIIPSVALSVIAPYSIPIRVGITLLSQCYSNR
jgi:hypothetical protein